MEFSKNYGQIIIGYGLLSIGITLVMLFLQTGGIFWVVLSSLTIFGGVWIIQKERKEIIAKRDLAAGSIRAATQTLQLRRVGAQTVGDGLGIRPAAGIAALTALGLGQDVVDLVRNGVAFRLELFGGKTQQRAENRSQPHESEQGAEQRIL